VRKSYSPFETPGLTPSLLFAYTSSEGFSIDRHAIYYMVINYSIEVSEPADVDLDDLVDELKLQQYLNNGTAEDTLLLRFLKTAFSLFEFESRSIVFPTTFKQHFPDWCSVLDLKRAPVTSVISVKYYDADDVEQTLEGWDADLTGVPALVYLPDTTYPALSINKLRPITIEFTAGNAADLGYCPDDIVVAVLQLAGHLYSQREAFSDTSLEAVPAGFQRVCDLHKSGLGGL
jgi:uncharacterized phiE125 gp8 family phage protein